MEERIYITELKIKRKTLLITIKHSGSVSTLQACTHFCNAWLDHTHAFPVSQSGTDTLQCSIDISSLETNEGDWEFFLYDKDSGISYTPTLSNQCRLSLLLGRHYIRSSGLLYFPMGGSAHKLLIRCRHWQKYDRLSHRIKELTAFIIYKLFGRFLKKEHIWLVYEKYCITAQENGFYFFEYCMKHEKKHVFFILDKSSPQWEYMQKYHENIIPFLSFRHILYLLCADLYISPDARYHAYAWKPMPNPITRELNRKKLLFLQHGVTAMKKVDHLFGAKGSSPVSYFVTTSEMEQKIITDNFGYTAEQVPVLGFPRWDGLQDTSDPAHPVILLMPTWRSWLEGQDDETFRQSSYYQHYSRLLNNPELQDCLCRHHLKLAFYIHPKLREFISSFHSDDSQIELISFNSVPLHELLMKCSLMITDYSSACWDAYYMKKPILFYQFDLEQYNKTNGSYINMEHDLFGDRCMHQSDLIQFIEEYANNHFHEKSKYADMRKEYFSYQDHNNCQRTYEYIKSQGF
ncbi:CDP-glycerol glycerophosphotransferase family protein [Blautia sp. MSJ-19]|uniref:CDP-glycerol glycerophosphotransferase family protein n=1 Tax=Blautia sp. MSJ-19 TaxID=2841517 RepID=UPI001C0ED804|nr:CDP-glycerol glycerophosphotransferase family protein [Blautia sp. MSJ-19]MBU5482553.1 CDP-glycerol glycerophosphotransferase family protein [Blautia sp. MSJ-19]